MEGLCSSSAISHSRHCRSVVSASPGRGLAGSLAASTQGLPGSRHTLQCLQEAGWGPGQPRCSRWTSQAQRLHHGEHHSVDSSQSLCSVLAQSNELSLPQEVCYHSVGWWAVGLEVSGFLDWAVTLLAAGLLGVGPLLCLQGGHVNRKGTSGSGQGCVRCIAWCELSVPGSPDATGGD